MGERRRAGAVTEVSVRGDVLSPLFEGQTGALHLGRRQPDGRLVLLRHVTRSNVPIVREALEQAIALRDVAVSPVCGLLESEGEAYVASLYIDGLALNEFLRLASTPRCFGEVLRILHDALLVAERLDARRAAEGLGPSRYLFSDTIWVTLQGKVVISEPVVAAHLLHVAPTSQTFERRVTPGSARALASDVEELAGLLGKWHVDCFGTKHGPLESSRALLGANVEAASRHDLARKLADLSEQPVASPAQVAAAVQRLAGTELVRRRLLGAQVPQAAPAPETTGMVDSVGGRAALGRPDGPPPPSPPPASLQSAGRQRLAAVGDGASHMAPRRDARTVWGGPNIYDASVLDDEDEVTAAFRPSQLPRLLAGGEADVFDRPTATPPEPQSLQVPRPTEPTASDPEARASRPVSLESGAPENAVATEELEEQQVVLELKVRRAPAAADDPYAAAATNHLHPAAADDPYAAAATDHLHPAAATDHLHPAAVADDPYAAAATDHLHPAAVTDDPYAAAAGDLHPAASPALEAPAATAQPLGSSAEVTADEASLVDARSMTEASTTASEVPPLNEPVDAIVELQGGHRRWERRLVWLAVLVFILGLGLLWGLPRLG